jgi:hypothetical protein
MPRALPTTNYYVDNDPFNFGADVTFLPFGLIGSVPVTWWIFLPLEQLHPSNYTENQLKHIY